MTWNWQPTSVLLELLLASVLRDFATSLLLVHSVRRVDHCSHQNSVNPDIVVVIIIVIIRITRFCLF